VANNVRVSAFEISDPEVTFSDHVPIIIQCNVTICSMYDALNVDDLIVQLSSSGLGCQIGNKVLGSVMYADNLLVLSASVDGLQSVSDCCYAYGQAIYIAFNSNKSVCCRFGFGSENKLITDMLLGNISNAWINSFY